jgi:MoxR-like ATPase
VAKSGSQTFGAFAKHFTRITESVEHVIQGKSDVVRLCTLALLAEGHILIEDVPGVGKTMLAKALARSLGCSFRRIQFTPDLLPSDITGVRVWARQRGVEFRPGPIFAQVVLGDEINRASPKTQSALLEAMEEHQVTVDATTYPLASPFMVIATQNPIEHEGTYPLPESQLDRFLMRIAMGYPDRTSEVAMLDAHAGSSAVERVTPVASGRDVDEMIGVARLVHVAPVLKGYLVDLATATRRHPSAAIGASPRATLALQRAARAYAASIGREYIVPDDIKALAGPVLSHRIVLTPEAELGGSSPDQVLGDVLASVPVPSGRPGA